MTVESFKVVEAVGQIIVQVGTLILAGYGFKLVSTYFHFRLSTTGKPIFEPQEPNNENM